MDPSDDLWISIGYMAVSFGILSVILKTTCYQFKINLFLFFHFRIWIRQGPPSEKLTLWDVAKTTSKVKKEPLKKIYVYYYCTVLFSFTVPVPETFKQVCSSDSSSRMICSQQ